MRIIRSILTLVAGFVLASGTTYAAPTTDTWANDLLNVQVLSPNPQTVQFNGNFNVPASNINLFGIDYLQFSIDPTSVVLRNFSQGPVPLSASTIIKITDLDARRIQNAQFDGSSTATAPLISGNNFLQFDAYDFPGHAIPGSATITVDVGFTSSLGATPTPAPEPVSLVLFGTGLVGFGLIRRLRPTPSA